MASPVSTSRTAPSLVVAAPAMWDNGITMREREKASAEMSIYSKVFTNLFTVRDITDSVIPAGEGRYVVTGVANGMVKFMNTDNGAWGEISEEYFGREFAEVSA